MGNMSYCRFENTNSDLQDCVEALEGLRGGDQEALSESELMKAKALVLQCVELIEMIQEEDPEGGESLLEMGRNKRKQVIARVLDKMNQAAKGEDTEGDDEDDDE